MGLDTTHDCWHGAYSSFYRFRAEIARAAGWPMVADERGRSNYFLDESKYEPKNFMGEWDERPDDVLEVFLAHSDCDGEIKAEHARDLAERLLDLEIDDAEAAEQREQFAFGLLRAADANEPVLFR